MGRKKNKRKLQREGAVFFLSSEEATLSKMPKYNAYAGGYGAHGSKKYDRRKSERDFRKQNDL